MNISRNLLAALVGTLLVPSAWGQRYPARPIRVIVAYPAGGANDIVARTVGQKMSELLGQPIVVDNRGGAGGTIGADVAAKSPPDGYTLLMGAGGHTLAPSLYSKLPYDISTWWGLFAPAGTSSEIVHRLSANMAKIVTLPDIRERFAALGIEPAANTPEQFALLVKAEVEKFARLAKAAGIKPE